MVRNPQIRSRGVQLPALVLFLGFSLQASHSLPTGSPESVGMSASRLVRIDGWLQGLVEAREAAGFVTLVSRRGTVVHHRATGRLGMSVSDPMPLDALFDVASMTKPLTAVVALTLFEEGRITLTDPVGEHIPEFLEPKVQRETGTLEPAAGRMLVRHLFTHTSGVRDPRSRQETYSFPSMDVYVREFARLPLQAEPGSTWIYGDSLDVLGHLAERVTGKRLDELLAARILEPLGMRDTHYWPPDSKRGRRALLVVEGKDDPTRESREPPEAGRRKSFISGASGLHTTAADYWRFCQMLLNGGDLGARRVLGPRTVSLLAEDHLEEGTRYQPGLGYGLGVAVVKARARSGLPYSDGSYYWGGSQGTLFWIDPAEELIGILMVQARPSGALRLRQKFGALVYSSIIQ
ncbi:MAG: serine hydrolase [Bryobacterales bacterium]|nr:serine hydrolase [Bryobacterales bacterium]